MADTETTGGAIFTDEVLTEAMHTLLSALEDWEKVCAAEEFDLDEMEEVDGRFVHSLSRLNAAMQASGRRRTVPAK